MKELAVQLVPSLGVLLGLLCLWGALRAARRQRLIDNLPTCKTTGVFIGLVELKGTAESHRPLRSFLAQCDCVHYRWSVDEHWSRTVTEHYTDSEGHSHTRTRHESGWTTVASGGDVIPFFLRDDLGAVLVRPGGAKIEPAPVFDETCGRSHPLYYDKGPRQAVADSDHRRRFHEQAVKIGAPIYVMGQARERTDVIAPEIAADRDAPFFLISTRTEEQVRRGFWWKFWLLGILGLLVMVGAWIGGDAAREHVRAFTPQELRVPLYVGVGAAYLFMWLIGWVWMVFNSLVDLRQRVRQAWSNVDVQLKRRADLIPNLVRVIEGLRDHERIVQTDLARIRAQATATRPGESGPDPEGCSASVSAVVESYPELKSNEAFLRLQRELSDTEQHIGLAREYFNSLATFYNSRLEIVPDRFIAALGAMRPQPLITAQDFERAPVSLDFAGDESGKLHGG